MRLRGRPQAAAGPQGRAGRENFGPDGNGGGGARRAEGRSPSQAAGGRRSRPEGAACPAGLGLRFAESCREAGRKTGGSGSFLFIIPTLMRDVTYFLRVG